MHVRLIACTISAALLVSGCGGGDQAEPHNPITASSATSNVDQRISEVRKKLKRVQRQISEARSRGGEDEAVTVEGANGGGADAGAEHGTGNSLSAAVDNLERSLGAELGVAITPVGGGPISTAGSLQSGSAWSTSKLLIVLRVIEDAGGPGGLSAEQQELVERAITLSDNEAAASLFRELEGTYGGTAAASQALDEVLRAGGDATTKVATQGRDGFSSYGQTEWALVDQASFMAQLAVGNVADEATTDYVLAVMGRVTSDQWGLGSLPGDDQWKGGWGPGIDGRYLDRQTGAIELADGSRVAVAIAARAGDGTFESGQTAATQLAEAVYREGSG